MIKHHLNQYYGFIIKRISFYALIHICSSVPISAIHLQFRSKVFDQTIAVNASKDLSKMISTFANCLSSV